MRLLTIFKTLLVLTVAVVGIASRMDAAAISYTINFTGGTPLPTSGSFKYDPITPNFTNFLVQWNGVLFNLTDAANSPGFYPGTSSCLSGETGAEVTFSVLSHSTGPSCPFDPVPYWGANTNTGATSSTFYLLGLGDPSFGPYYRYIVDLPGGAAGSVVTWSGGPISVVEQTVPEPSSFIPITLVGVLLARKRIAQGLRLATRKNR